ncbi:MAG: glycosyltransferase, partial [Gemmatimonadales bacterium]
MTQRSADHGRITFSVVIATFDRPEQLSRCIRAIGALKYPRDQFEVIVVNDGGSTQALGDLQALAGGVDLQVISTGNLGPGAARNTGAAAAKGEFIAFVDDDCIPPADWLSNLSAAVSRSPDAMIGGRTVNSLKRNLFSQASQTLVEYVYSYYNERGAYRTEFFASNNMTLSANAFHSIDGFDKAFRTAEDRELCNRWRAGGGQFVYDANVVMVHAHQLRTLSFLRQHFGYGRGALPYWEKSTPAGVRGIRVEPLAFYAGMMIFPFRQHHPYAMILS